MQVAILLMAGKSRRFQSETPKQFHLLSGKMLYQYALQTAVKSNLFDLIILVCPKNQIATVKNHNLTKNFLINTKKTNKSLIKLIIGGKTRQESVFKALLACPKKTSLVLIHDAVRPFVSRKILKENIALAKKHQAVDTCLKSFDTIVHSKDLKKITKIPLRKEYLRGQTPQTFAYPLILKAHLHARQKNYYNASDDCQLVLKLKKPVHIATGDEHNLKITTQLDLFLAEQILRTKTEKQSDILSNQKPKNQKIKQLKNKKYIIVGASGGIGSVLCQLLKRQKAQVLAISRTSIFAADITKPKTLKTIFQKIHQKYGPVDGLINTAGFLKTGFLKELDDKTIEKTIHTNLTGLIHICKYVKIKKHGHIINIASSSYAKGRAFYPVYSAAKAAVVNFTQAIAEEMPSLKINALVPSRTDTALRRKNFTDENPKLLLSPQKVAETIYQILAYGKTTGTIIELKKNS